MKILALIPARGGSQRLPGKNIRMLGGKPMIVWSIEAAKGIAEICDILVSTDDPTIAKACTEAGAYVPWMRPKELASHSASSIDVALHALDWYESKHGDVDGLLLLQPTSPFRSQKTVRAGIELFTRGGQQPVVGVSPAESHPMWTLKMAGEYVVPFMQDHGFDRRSQDLPMAYAINGSFYLISPTDLRTKRSFIGLTTRPLILESPEESLDIDTMWDFTVAELVAKSNHDC